MECCGRKRITPHCPICGIFLTGDPTIGLLVKIRGMIKGRKSRTKYAIGSQLVNLQHQLDEWESYEKALLNLIDERSEFIRREEDKLPTLNIEELKSMAIKRAMIVCNQNRFMAAKKLGIGERTLYRELSKNLQNEIPRSIKSI